MEVWKDVVGYEGIYQVSSLGRIKSVNYYRKTNREQVRKPCKRKDGYLSIALSKDGKTITKTVHRIVATAFIPNPNNLEMINHKDEDRTNNSVDNLEWCSRSYNQIYSMNIHSERRKVFGNNFLNDNGESSSPFTKRGVPHKYNIKVVQKDRNGVLLRIFNNASEAGEALNLRSSNIITACKDNQSRKFKKKHTAYGYIWEFLNE